MDKVANAEMLVIYLVEKAQTVMHKQREEWMTEDEKVLVSEAREIGFKVSEAIQKAQDEADAISNAEGVRWPAPYQALVDELDPLIERRDITTRFSKAMGSLVKNPYYYYYARPGSFDPWNRVLQGTLANEVFEAWQTGGRDASFTRMNLIQYQMDNKNRSGSKAQRSRDEWNRRYTQRRNDAARIAEREIHAANPSWETTLQEHRKLGATLETRKADDLALFQEPINEALKELQAALAEAVNV